MFVDDSLKPFPPLLRQHARLHMGFDKLTQYFENVADNLSSKSPGFIAPITVLNGLEHLCDSVEAEKLAPIAAKIARWCHSAFSTANLTEDLENAARVLPLLMQAGLYVNKKAISKSPGLMTAYKIVQMGPDNSYDVIFRAMNVLQYAQEAGINLSARLLQIPIELPEHHRRQKENAQDRNYAIRRGDNYTLLSPLPPTGLTEAISLRYAAPAGRHKPSATLKSNVNSFLKNGA